MEVIQRFRKNLSFWSPATKRVYDNDLWASVVQISGKAKVSVPATSVAVNRTNDTAAYLRYPFFLEPTTTGKSPPITQVTQLTQDYLDDNGEASERNAYIFVADDLDVESDGSPTAFPTIEEGDLLLVEGSINNGSPDGLDVESDPTLVASEKPRIGTFGQAIPGRVTSAGQRDLWLIGGNDNLAAFSPKAGHDYVSVEVDDSGVLSIDCTHQNDLDVLWPTCCIITADILLDQLLYTGGMSDWGTLEVASRIYSYDGTAMTIDDCSESLTKAAALSVPIANVIMFTGGVNDTLDDSKDSIVFFDPYTKSWSAGTYYLKTARRDHQMVIVDGGVLGTAEDVKWALVIGGKAGLFSNVGQLSPDVAPIGTPINKCELVALYSTTQGAIPAAFSTNTGSMSDARYAFGSVRLPDGRVLVVGGIGNNPSTAPILDETAAETGFELSSCEIFDPLSGLWSPIESMREPHSYCVCNYAEKSNRVYVYGGYTSTKVEYLDLDTMHWHLSLYELDEPCVAGAAINFGFDFSALIGGGSYNQTTSTLTPNDDAVDGSSWNSVRTTEPEYSRYDGLNSEWILEEHDVSSNWWKLTPYRAMGNYAGTDVRWSDAALDDSGARFVLAKSATSQAVDIRGPYTFDTEQPFSVSGVNLVLDQTVKKGSYVGTITVTSGASSVGEGYLVFNYGHSSQVGPVRCFGYIDDATLIIDSGFRFPYDLASGDAINVLYQRATLVPDEGIGALWLTASSAGRIAAIEMLKGISAAGIVLEISTRYPGDRGIGGEGEPWSDNYRLSDIVSCFGGDNLDEELEEARGIDT